MSRVDTHAQHALRASAAGLDADPWLRAFLDGCRSTARVDAVGVLVQGLDGRARVRAWSGRGATRARDVLRGEWPIGDPVRAEALAAMGLGSAAVTVCGPHALLVAARRGGTAPAPLAAEPLIEALLVVEQGRAASAALGAAAAICATTTTGEVWRAVSHTLDRRFATGQPTSVQVPGSLRSLDASVTGVADESALAAIADLVAIALGRDDRVPAV